MNKKTDVELERAITIKVTRTLITLKYSVMAARELNEVLPARLAEFDKAVHTGELKYLPIPTVNEVLDGTKETA